METIIFHIGNLGDIPTLKIPYLMIKKIKNKIKTVRCYKISDGTRQTPIINVL